MANTEKILAIDIGACSLKFASFTFPPAGGLVLEKFAFKEISGDLQEDEYKVAFRQALSEAIEENNFDEKKVYFSFSGQSAFIRFVKLPPIGEEEGRVKQIVEYEARQNVPFPIEEVIWDYQLIGDIENDAEIETMFVVVKNDVIDELISAIEENGKEPVIIDVAPTVAYNSARANGIGEDDCSMILNIGGKCSSLIFIDSGRFFVRPIPIAGVTVTQQISKEFGIPFDDAEELKKKHGFVALGGAYEEPDSEVAATVSKIVRNVMTRLHGEINRSINVYRSQRKGTKPSKLYLAGGSSVMAFTPRFFSEKLKIPVEYFNPFQIVSLAPHIDKEALAEVAHMYSEVIGLGLRYVTECPIEISLVPPALKQQHELRRKSPYFYAAAGSLILCLGILWGAFNHNTQRSLNMLSQAETFEKITRKEADKLKQAEKDQEAAVYNYQSALNMLDGRGNWVNLLNEVQKVLPDNIWLTKVKASSKHSQPVPANRNLTNRYNLRDTGNANIALPDVEWIEIHGHSLILDNKVENVEVLKQNFVSSEYFTNNIDDVKIVSIRLGTVKKAKNNLTEFTMEIKLKTPIKQ